MVLIVYTTTKRRLLDPTAERLENYWWRIWGSRSRHLKAAIVVQIFADISEGQSFVPLRSQANRDEGTPPKDVRNYATRIQTTFKLTHQQVRPLPRGASSTTAIHRTSTSKPGTTPKQSMPPPPSILKGSDSTKKARNPSTSGPKPTARFISPHESEEEVLVSPKTPVITHPPSPVPLETRVDKKLAASNSRKKAVFVASARGKRPAVMRRQSSQSSTDGSVRAENQMQSSADRTPPNFADHARELAQKRGQVSSQENSSSSSGKVEKKSVTKSARSIGKSVSPRKLPLDTRKSSREDSAIVAAGPSSKTSRNCGADMGDLDVEELEEIEVQRLRFAQANARVAQEHFSTPQIVQDERADVANNRTSKTSTMPLPPMRSKSAVSLAPTLATAVGHNDTEAVTTSPKIIDKDIGRDTANYMSNDLFSKRPIGSFSASSTPHSSNGLIRSKSQLTLLLEKDRVKTNERSASSIHLKDKQKK